MVDQETYYDGMQDRPWLLRLHWLLRLANPLVHTSVSCMVL